jgi:hypothetical protein
MKRRPSKVCSCSKKRADIDPPLVESEEDKVFWDYMERQEWLVKK